MSMSTGPMGTGSTGTGSMGTGSMGTGATLRRAEMWAEPGPREPVTPTWSGLALRSRSGSSAMKAGLWVTAVGAAPACAGAVWLAAHQPFGRPTEPGPVLTVLVGVSLVGSGLGAWRARPENRVGRIMVFTGFAWFAAQLVEARAPGSTRSGWLSSPCSSLALSTCSCRSPPVGCLPWSTAAWW